MRYGQCRPFFPTRKFPTRPTLPTGHTGQNSPTGHTRPIGHTDHTDSTRSTHVCGEVRILSYVMTSITDTWIGCSTAG